MSHDENKMIDIQKTLPAKELRSVLKHGPIVLKSRLGVEPARCVVFEDTDIGLEAARRAGMTGVDVRAWLPPRLGEVSKSARG